jgi:uncharacterized surface protein with fasciclin (FAS1) repeats
VAGTGSRRRCGEWLRILEHGDKVQADGGTLIETDVEATNGVIHVIDSVMPGKGGK